MYIYMYIFRSERNVRSKYIDLRETLIEIHYIHTYIIYIWIYVYMYIWINIWCTILYLIYMIFMSQYFSENIHTYMPFNSFIQFISVIKTILHIYIYL